ncbi:hypothetical protein RI129_012723 [Pyrocoelia pectoralis]|uniref:UBA domain-containing protein n=1 Tax=Pyrocoelia pectoralis TaxID=417401 RepID=A0AAN7UZZ2_9COLE
MAQVSLKIFNRNIDETRRLSIDESVCSNYLFITEKIQTLFPSLRRTNYKLTWKDNDGDYVRITGDEDLITAFTEMSGNTKVLYIDSDSKAPSTNNACPYSDAFDLQNLHAMARQYLEPLLASPQSEQAQMLAETIRNAAAGFFGKQSQGNGNENGEKGQETKKADENRPGSSQPKVDQKIEEGLARLKEMGFKNDNGFLRKLLEHLNGDVEGVVKILAN